MAVLVAHDLVPGRRLRADSDLIGHRTAGHEAGGFFAKEIRASLLEPVYGGVITQNVITQWGLHHRQLHGVGGLGDCVAAEVNGGRHGCPW